MAGRHKRGVGLPVVNHPRRKITRDQRCAGSEKAMPEVRSSISLTAFAAQGAEAFPSDDNPSRAFANGIMFSLPLWALIGVGIWAIF